MDITDAAIRSLIRAGSSEPFTAPGKATSAKKQNDNQNSQRLTARAIDKQKVALRAETDLGTLRDFFTKKNVFRKESERRSFLILFRESFTPPWVHPTLSPSAAFRTGSHVPRAFLLSA